MMDIIRKHLLALAAGLVKPRAETHVPANTPFEKLQPAEGAGMEYMVLRIPYTILIFRAH